MTLGFSTHINGQPTYFVEKIWNGIWDGYTQEYWDFFAKELEYRNVALHKAPATLGKKIHTIRADQKDRWKPGNKIHFVIHNRTPNRFQFAPVFVVNSIQEIEIKWTSSTHHKKCVGVYIDGMSYGFAFGQEDEITEWDKTLEELAYNDGFHSIDQFLHWFSDDFSGKIIHWTDFSY